MTLKLHWGGCTISRAAKAYTTASQAHVGFPCFEKRDRIFSRIGTPSENNLMGGRGWCPLFVFLDLLAILVESRPFRVFHFLPPFCRRLLGQFTTAFFPFFSSYFTGKHMGFYWRRQANVTEEETRMKAGVLSLNVLWKINKSRRK